MILRAENLVKKYKSRTVVKGVSVEVKQGEIVGLLGPNGAGKTTSFYMIVGLIQPNGGRIFMGIPVSVCPMLKLPSGTRAPCIITASTWVEPTCPQDAGPLILRVSPGRSVPSSI